MGSQPNPIDVHVGGRLRFRRMLIGMSQEKLGNALGLTFQQIQKYEKGSNRVGASRLFEISRVLGVDVQFFFDGLAGSGDGGQDAPRDPAIQQVMDFVGSAEGLQLNAAFSGIRDAATRRRLLDLVKTLAAEAGMDASRVA